MSYRDANADLLSAIASQLQSEKMTSEEVAKLLNTVARFEERVNEVIVKDSMNPVDSDVK